MDERARPSATREAVSRRGRLSRSATRDGGALRTERTERGDERRLSLRSHAAEAALGNGFAGTRSARVAESSRGRRRAAEDLPGGRRPLRDLQLIGVSGIPIPDDQWSGLAFATGLVDNVEQTYLHIVQNHEPGDQPFMFGFSRSAYTVRVIAGLLEQFGLLRRDQSERTHEVVNSY